MEYGEFLKNYFSNIICVWSNRAENDTSTKFFSTHIPRSIQFCQIIFILSRYLVCYAKRSKVTGAVLPIGDKLIVVAGLSYIFCHSCDHVL
jgi:hypothetical protein